MSSPSHIPVLLDEVIQSLAVKPGGRYIDCTVGGGGHAAAILEDSSPGGQLLGIDADPKAIELARARLDPYGESTLLVNDNFVNLRDICTKHGFFPVHGILFDLGLSSIQLNGNGRGFSFQHEAPLDMRLNPSQKVTASHILNTYPETKLANLIATYGEERRSRQIARSIVQERPIQTTLHLVRTVEKAIRTTRGRIHPATRTFQALRIAVNRELENLQAALKQAVSLLGFEGRLVVISYHSLEDRIVKQFMRQEARGCVCPPGTPTCVCHHTRILKLITKKVITPSPQEVQRNPRSRSAKLRAAERIIPPGEQYNTAENMRSLSRKGTQGWRRSALVRRLRRTFLAVQIEYF
jgi:16S rRNA (cytosine1402-N4)-methyltransferase